MIIEWRVVSVTGHHKHLIYPDLIPTKLLEWRGLWKAVDRARTKEWPDLAMHCRHAEYNQFKTAGTAMP